MRACETGVLRLHWWYSVSANWKGGGDLAVCVYVYINTAESSCCWKRYLVSGNFCDQPCQCPLCLSVCVFLWDMCTSSLWIEPAHMEKADTSLSLLRDLAETPGSQGTGLGSDGQAGGTPGLEQLGKPATFQTPLNIFKLHHFCFVKNRLWGFDGFLVFCLFLCLFFFCLGYFLFASFA